MKTVRMEADQRVESVSEEIDFSDVLQALESIILNNFDCPRLSSLLPPRPCVTECSSRDSGCSSESVSAVFIDVVSV